MGVAGYVFVCFAIVLGLSLAVVSARCMNDSLRFESDLDDWSESSSSVPFQVYAEPEEKWPEHSVPFTVHAVCRSESEDVPSGPKRSSSPSILDSSLNSALSLIVTTGDGRPNLVGIDTTGDGFVDSLAVDTTGDGRVDHVCSAGTNSASVHLIDTSVSLDV